MRKLILGIIEFRNEKSHDYRKKFARLALGQSPDALFSFFDNSPIIFEITSRLMRGIVSKSGAITDCEILNKIA